MLCPNTARPDRSIWDTVSRKTFETNVDALSQAKIAPGPRILTRNDWPEQRQKDRLGFGISLQLSDDFAFISACDCGVGYVTVAAIEQARNGEYTLRLAANEGICASVKTALLELLDVLRNCATKGNTLPASFLGTVLTCVELSRDQCSERSFHIIVNLNKNRILGRLESTHFQRPIHDRGSPRNALSVRLKELLTRAIVRTPIRKTHLATLSHEVDAFHESFVRLENSRPGEAIDAVKAVVKNAYEITVDGISLPRRLSEIGLSTADSRAIREVNKIANYWRICLTLTHLSRSHRSLFSGLRLDTLEPYTPLREIGQKRYVHA
jgi:hypothetical protein